MLTDIEMSLEHQFRLLTEFLILLLNNMFYHILSINPMKNATEMAKLMGDEKDE